MAIVKLGFGISGISGSVGGATFKNSSSGQVVQNKPSQLKKHTKAQCLWLSKFHYVSSYWKNSLTPTQQQLYNDASSGMQFKNAFGDTTFISGQNFFIKKNLYRILAGLVLQTTVNNYPGFASTLLPVPSLINVTASNSRLTLSTGAFTGFVETSSLSKLLVFASPMVSSDTKVNMKFKRFIGYFSGAGVGGGFSPAYLAIPFPIRSGRYINFEVVHLDSESRFSNSILFNKGILA